MTCEIISNAETLADWLVWPTGCFYEFWLLILGVLMIVVAWGIYKTEEGRRGEGDFIGALAVSSIAFTLIAAIGTLIKNSADIPMIQSDILIYFVAFAIIMIPIWMFKD